MPKVFTFYGVVSQLSYDGDGIRVNLDQGLETWKHDQQIRFQGCNAIELKDPGGKETRDHLRSLTPPGTKVRIDSYGYDKYGGRLDAKVYLLDGRDIIEEMIRDKWLVRWDAKGERPLPAWPRVG